MTRSFVQQRCISGTVDTFLELCGSVKNVFKIQPNISLKVSKHSCPNSFPVKFVGFFGALPVDLGPGITNSAAPRVEGSMQQHLGPILS